MTADSSSGAPISAHPRIHQRRAAVEDQSTRSRNRKLVAAGVVVLAGLLAAASTQSPLLDVDEVRVVGAVRRSPEQVRESAAVELGTPLVGLDLDAVEDRLGALPDIAAVTLSKDWSGVVTIEIAERLAVARIASDEGTVVLAADGVVLAVTPDVHADLPAISGAMFSVEPGDRAPVELTDAIAVASAMPTDVAQVVERIEITVDSLLLRLVGGGTVALGDARDLDAKFDSVRAFLLQVDLACLETLNVQAPSVPVIIRRPQCSG